MAMADEDPLADLMTPDEVAAELKIRRKTLMNRRLQGLAPEGFRVGKSVRFRREDVWRWLDEQRAADAIRARRQPAWPR
jgi:hypothetical protein